jgi:hypothetical protein
VFAVKTSDDPDPDDPYALAAVGDWRAAAVWKRLRCPFERAHAR